MSVGKTGPGLIVTGTMGGVASSSPFIQQLSDNAAAYGLMLSAIVGFLGLVVTIIFGLLKHKEQRRFNDQTLRNQIRVLEGRMAEKSTPSPEDNSQA